MESRLHSIVKDLSSCSLNVSHVANSPLQRDRRDHGRLYAIHEVEMAKKI